jgi:hypothetical protein
VNQRALLIRGDSNLRIPPHVVSPQDVNKIGFYVYKSLKIHAVSFCVITPYNLVGSHQGFEKTFCFQLQCISEKSFKTGVSYVSFSKIFSPIHKSKRCRKPEDHNMNP